MKLFFKLLVIYFKDRQHQSLAFSGVVLMMVFIKFYIIFIVLQYTTVLSGFELTRAILSSDNNPNYKQFWPIVAKVWKLMGLRPTLILISETDEGIDASLGDVIRFSPVADLPTSYQAQVLRLFVPILFPEDGCIISDIDMIPISRSYFIDGANSCSDDNFLVYRDKVYMGEERYPMCYVAAKGSVFGSVFGIKSSDDFIAKLYEWYSEGLGWDTDEIMMSRTLLGWERRGDGKICRLGHGMQVLFNRIDRSGWKENYHHFNIQNIIDCHCPRPYNQYKKTIDQIVYIIEEKSKL